MNGVLETRNAKLVEVPGMLTELVRGCDRQLLAHVDPLVRCNDVTLDFRAIERIDAAGIAALILLYGRAHEAGHTFHVCNVQSHVAEILGLVGLDRILVAQDGGSAPHSPCARLARAAA